MVFKNSDGTWSEQHADGVQPLVDAVETDTVIVQLDPETTRPVRGWFKNQLDEMVTPASERFIPLVAELDTRQPSPI